MQSTNELTGQLMLLPDGHQCLDEFADHNARDVLSPSHLMQAKIQIEEKADKKASVYNPIPSVWTGEDNELLERLLSFYPRKDPERILDAT